MEHKKGKAFFYVLLGLVIILVLAIFRPFLVEITLSIAFAVVLYPIYRWFLRKLGNIPWLASIITTLLFFLVLTVPLYFIGAKIVTEAGDLYNSLTQSGVGQENINHLITWVNNNVPGAESLDLRGKVADIAGFITSKLGTVFATTLQAVLSVLIMLLALFYFLKDGHNFRDYLVRISPLPDRHDDKIFDRLSSAVNGVMRGYVLIAIVQGTLLGIGLFIFGVPNPVLWGALAGIASMIPSIGTGIVAIPAIAYLLLTGATFPALGLLIWSLALVGTIDNILNPIVVGKNIDLPPLAVLFAVLGGLTLFGIAGLIIGPLALSLFLTLMPMYKESYSAD